MYVKNMQLINFRNYENIYLELNPNINVFIGDNAQGKTNILESIYYSSVGKSHRTNRDKELINWNKDYAYLKLYVSKNRLDKIIDMKILKNSKKAISINSIKISKISQLMGVLNVVMFSPEDLKIVKESPVFRRKFLDVEICKISNAYYHNLVQYNKVLFQRNTLLKKWNKNGLDMLDIYDNQIAHYGALIIKDRKKYIERLNIIGSKIHSDITNGIENINFKYIDNIVDDGDEFKNQLLKLFLKYRNKDLERRTTSVGPHRDDFSIVINNIDIRNFGSQGQQRTSVLTLKFASLEIIKDVIGEYPVLLLDDVLSELDSKRQKYVLNSISNIQTLITCTGIEEIEKYLDRKSQLYVVNKGGIKTV
ncbi:DNA replication/repair protein RecF [Clostridium oceanicum]|uniref:DNA replication and repair protein RecF n=1 Tax=Clostridium oceanicum TaxID=1543 RepID=A0ABN1JS93_9CLOT